MPEPRSPTSQGWLGILDVNQEQRNHLGKSMPRCLPQIAEIESTFTHTDCSVLLVFPRLKTKKVFIQAYAGSGVRAELVYQFSSHQ